ncbi:calcium/proton exchanger [Cenococcum geophilum]
MVNYLYVNSITIFIVNFITIILLTIMLNYTTKEITLRAGNILGSLLNVTFRNAITIVKTSLISSMLSNLLLILSIYFFFGVTNTAASLLALFVSSLIILTAFYSTLSILNWELSHGTAIILLIIYGVIITLRFSTTLVAFYSNNITASGTVSTTFIGLTLLLIVRNTAKYIIAVIVAYKDKISLIINIAIRSILSFVDYIILLFNTFLIAILFIAILLVNYLIQDSKFNWLKGVLIIAIYAIITVAG